MSALIAGGNNRHPAWHPDDNFPCFIDIFYSLKTFFTG